MDGGWDNDDGDEEVGGRGSKSRRDKLCATSIIMVHATDQTRPHTFQGSILPKTLVKL